MLENIGTYQMFFSKVFFFLPFFLLFYFNMFSLFLHPPVVVSRYCASDPGRVEAADTARPAKLQGEFGRDQWSH